MDLAGIKAICGNGRATSDSPPAVSPRCARSPKRAPRPWPPSTPAAWTACPGTPATALRRRRTSVVATRGRGRSSRSRGRINPPGRSFRLTTSAMRRCEVDSRPTRARGTAAVPSTTTTSSGALRRIGGVARRAGRGRPGKAFRGPWVGPGSRHRRASRCRIRGKACLGDHARGGLVRASRVHRRVGAAAGRRPIASRVRPVHRLHSILSDRAIVAPGVIDARRCISYLTIEHRGPIPDELRSLMGTWAFGCDLCQEACPINHRLAPQPLEVATVSTVHGPVPHPDLIECLELTDAEFTARFRATAVARTGRAGLARNCAIALGNAGMTRRSRAATPVPHPTRTRWCVRPLAGGSHSDRLPDRSRLVSGRAGLPLPRR